jgi:hypothetical protein
MGSWGRNRIPDQPNNTRLQRFRSWIADNSETCQPVVVAGLATIQKPTAEYSGNPSPPATARRQFANIDYQTDQNCGRKKEASPFSPATGGIAGSVAPLSQ